MAEAVVGLLIGKLAAALLKEAAGHGLSLLSHEVSALKNVFDQVRRAKDELESMQAYLKGAERFKDTDETTGLFVKRIRGFAFEIEDVVDEFTYKLEDKHGGFVARTKKRIKHLKTWHHLARKLEDINTRLHEAKELNQHYAVPQIGTSVGATAVHANQALAFTRDEDLVGITENKELLTRWLAGDLEQRCKIATVCGMPGVGKTTLVSHVYKTIKLGFDAAAWVTVSQSYDIQELLRKIAGEFGTGADVANMEKERVAEIIYNYLQGKSYILVLDDVWTADVWTQLRAVFPSNNCIGRFVITSRNHEVSLLATSDSTIHLEPLEKDKSWELFCKSAFWNDGYRRCPSHLEDLALKFVDRCEGLPIAIACVGSLLSGRGQTYGEWKKTFDELELQLVKNVMARVETIVKVSLEDLPYDLKNCFLHCALFPEDYPISRRRVTRHWITSGFIKKKGNQTLEEVAGEYLIELVNRSLLQVVKRNYNGRLKCCRMHDVIRLVALKKAEEECFVKVYDGSREFSVGRMRRISILSGNLDQIGPSDASHVRSLHAFERYIDIELLRPILASSNLLSTLDLQGACISMLPSEVFNLFNLRYLGLRYTAIKSLSQRIERLQNLEVLDVVNSQLSYLPSGIAKLKKLRYLYACNVYEGSDEPFSGVKVPSGIRHLTSLQALQAVEASSEIMREVGDLTELRTFGVCKVRSEHSGDLIYAIKRMTHLVHLEISTLEESEMLHLDGLHLPTTISWLHLEGQLAKTSMLQVMSSWSHLSSLTKLQMSFSKVDEESFSSLLVLRSLCCLTLFKAFIGKKMHFPAGCFPKLHKLSIWNAPQLNQIQIEKGAMPILSELYLQTCPELKFLPQGIEHLTNLKLLNLFETSEELREKIQHKGEPNVGKDDLIISIRHIRKVFT